ncbi:IspD/TarI family cytidylyltransferase [Aquipuribacter nitratireducens]|uniref:2-C-methyl-D-erythritol 4-phosphate cytidylyltransferase n=1 Tax=Aquipuribacter nitratireducens TaxID=650104 RepID=A0ABW0GM96_9MICO
MSDLPARPDPAADAVGATRDEALPPSALVVLAAGSGRRVGAGTNKALLPLAGRPVLAWSLHRTAGATWCARTVVVARADELDEVAAVVAAADPRPGPVDVVAGGASRHASEAAALTVLADDVAAGRVQVVVVHDAARPLADAALFDAVVGAAARSGGAVPVVARHDLVPVEGPWDGGHPLALADVGSVQTPQAFAARPLLAAYTSAARDGFEGTDTAACVERYGGGGAVVAVPGSRRNLKVTFAGDLPVAAALLGG